MHRWGYSSYKTMTVAFGLFACAGYNVLQYYQQNKLIANRLNIIQKLFENGEPLESPDIAQGIVGRLKIMRPSDSNSFYTLSNKNKPFSFVVEGVGLYNLSQYKTDYDKVISLGHEKRYIANSLKKRYYFNLYLFPEKSNQYQCLVATWDNVFKLIFQTEPEIYKKIEKFKDDLENKTYDEIESESDFEFLRIYQLGIKDGRYMTKQRFLAKDEDEITISDVRFILYCWMGLNKLSSGDGYTTDKHGNKGCKEYLMNNMKLNDINQLKVVHLNVNCPSNN